jgi:DNA-binding response OmpR family regulator
VAKKILIADDEARLRILLSDFLVNEGYDILEAKDGQEALKLFIADSSIHLVILDVMMPYLDGWEVCEEIRKLSKIPIIMLTAKSRESDELNSFHKGADEYIRKPFSPSILVARVNALISRTYPDADQLILGDLSIDLNKHVVKIDNTFIDLSQLEYKLLYYLIQNKNSVLSREQLLNKVWGYDYEGTERTVDTHINRLRIKLTTCGDYIKTIRGFGYKFEVIK